MIRRFFHALLAAGAVALIVSPTAALASPRGRIVDVSTVNGDLRILFTATGLTSGSIDPASVHLAIDGHELSATAQPVGSGPAQISRSAMLVIDTSGSMVGEGLAGAKSAATAFLTAIPADVKVGLVTFSDTASVALQPTSNRDQLRSAISKLRAHGETALYDGVALALRTLGSSGARNVVLLTDGADTRSRVKLSALLAQVAASKVTVDAVGFRTSDTQSSPLRQIAAKGGGQVIAAREAGGLASAFKSAAEDIARQVIVTASIPKDLANSSHTISVSATAGGVTLTDQAFAPLGAAGKAHPTDPAQYAAKPVSVSKGLSKSVFWAALAALFVALVVMLAIALSGIARKEGGTGVRRRLSIYTLTGRPVEETREETSTVLGDSAVARSAVELAGRVVAKRDLESVLARKLDAAGVPMKPAEWLILHAGIAVVGALLLLLISGGGVLATVIGLAAGIVVPWLFLAFKEGRRTSAFLERMPDTLQLMAGGLRAGYSLPQSIDAVVREGSEPISSEFNRALVETRLGVSIEDALDGVAQRMQSQDFEWVVMAIRIQREVGGNLAEVLSTVAATLRERERLRRQVRVLSAEGRLSAWILGGLPVLFFLYLLLVRQSYVRQLWTDSIGIIMLVFLAIDLTVGVFWLRKVIRVEV